MILWLLHDVWICNWFIVYLIINLIRCYIITIIWTSCFCNMKVSFENKSLSSAHSSRQDDRESEQCSNEGDSLFDYSFRVHTANTRNHYVNEKIANHFEAVINNKVYEGCSVCTSAMIVLTHLVNVVSKMCMYNTYFKRERSTDYYWVTSVIISKSCP